MTYYGGKELAASFRTVRQNTIQIAEDIPEESYGFSPSEHSRTIARTLAHIGMVSAFQTYVHQNRLDSLAKVNFPELMKTWAAEENTPRSKAALIEFLKSEGDKYATYIESLPESFLAEEPVRDAHVRQGARDAPSRPAHGAAAHARCCSASDSADAGAVRAGAAAAGHPVSTPRFSPKALAFLRALKRNNDREWFKARKEQYETLLRAPLVEIVERLGDDFQSFAPNLVAAPKASIYRIYRDTRFSENKTPLKTHVAAVFPCRGLGRHQGAGLYFEVSPEGVWAGGGMYAPETSQIHAEREHIAANIKRLRAIVEGPGFKRHVGRLEGERLQRVPRGFPKDHPAAEFLKYRQFLAGKEFPASFSYSPRFYPGLLNVFRHLAPLIAFLNEPLR
jgi:uncharacterized protein (TIGR02453 family)